MNLTLVFFLVCDLYIYISCLFLLSIQPKSIAKRDDLYSLVVDDLEEICGQQKTLPNNV